MNAAVSNIAWTVADDDAAREMLAAAGVKHLEIAPTRQWPDLSLVSESEARSYAEGLQRRGFSVCAFQALLFGKPELLVFGKDDGRACVEYLARVCRLASWMGAKALVFGSPKNRTRESLSPEEAFAKGQDFFRALGDAAAAQGVVVCIEPNPAAYSCDFLQTASEAAAMVRAVNSPGIRLNLDMGELIMNGADVPKAVREFLPLAGHFHASEPMLEPFDPAREAHHAAAGVLRDAGYEGVVSLEMKTPQGGPAVVGRALHDMQHVYFAKSS